MARLFPGGRGSCRAVGEGSAGASPSPSALAEHGEFMARFRLALLLCCLLLPAAARADDPIDSVMYRSPDLPTPKVVRTFSDKLPGLWTEALGRPEADFRCQAALAVARAHEQGMGGLAVTV